MGTASIIDQLIPYLPRDRAKAIIEGRVIPPEEDGASLFADISGFTPLTEAVMKRYGPRRGGEELTNQLNRVYDALVDEVNRWGGTILGFAGDAITCWFSGDDGRHATACALGMQTAMDPFRRIILPGGVEATLAMKVAVASGRIRRFEVGEPSIQRQDIIAGAVLERLASTEHLADRDQVLVEAGTALRLGRRIQIDSWKEDDEGNRAAVVTGIEEGLVPPGLLPLDTTSADPASLRSWTPPAVYERVVSGQGEFLTELRPAAAVFVRFLGIDFENDPEATTKFDRYIRWIQGVISRLEGCLVQLTIGDKGSFFYASFGAPVAHDDDTARALTAAIEFRDAPRDLREAVGEVRIGVTRGVMRTGAYGGRARRTFGVLGDEVNLSARLMQSARPGQILTTERAVRRQRLGFDLKSLEPIRVKGKSEPIAVYEVRAIREQSLIKQHAARYTYPLIGRHEELACARSKLALAQEGRGQVLAFTADAGMGKSRLVAEMIRMADAMGFQAFGGDCPAFGAKASLSVWWPIWREFFGIVADGAPEAILESLGQGIQAIDPTFADRAPLLGPALNIPFPDNDLTRPLEPKVRLSSMTSLLVDCLRTRASRKPVMLVLEECHYLDPSSRGLLVALIQSIARMPVVIAFAHRPVESGSILSSEVAQLDYYHTIELGNLPEDDARRLVEARLGDARNAAASLPGNLVDLVVRKSEGNPFFIEEMLNLVRRQLESSSSELDLASIELPDSMHSLVLSRIDQLATDTQLTLKVASTVGRLYPSAIVFGIHPTETDPARVKRDLETIERRDFSTREPGEGEPTYLFKHIVIQEVAYESLPHAFRRRLHEAVGRELESRSGAAGHEPVDLLAFHYGRSENTEKKREYLAKAAKAAMTAYANDTALAYLLELLPLTDGGKRCDTLLDLGSVHEVVGDWASARAAYHESRDLADAGSDPTRLARAEQMIGDLLRKQGNFSEAREWLERARDRMIRIPDDRGLGAVLQPLGTLEAQTGNYEAAERAYTRSLEIRRAHGEDRRAADILNNLGILARFRGDYEACERLYAESLEIRERIKDRWSLANSYNNLGMLYRHRGEFGRSMQLLQKSIDLYRSIGDRWGIGGTHNSLAEVALDAGDLDTAAIHLVESVRIYRELGDKRALAFLLEAFAMLNARLGAPERAVFFAAAADRLRKEIKAPISKAEADKMAEVLGPIYTLMTDPQLEAANEEGKQLALGSVLDRALETCRN